MAALLKIQDLYKEFPTVGFGTSKCVCAVDGVSLEVYPGEIVGLVGESGCGKTTLARCALRLLEPTRGSIYFDDFDLRLLSAAALRQKRRQFQMVFQDPFASMDPLMTVGEILSEPYEIHRLGTRREREEWIYGLLDSVSLSVSLLNRRASQLSGGEQQRVVIARALTLKPQLLVADEPVSAVDASVQAQILNLLADLQKRFGLTLILISHSLYAAHYLCSRIAVMYFGRIVEDAGAADFFRAPKHPYSEILLGSMPSLDTSCQSPKTRPAGDIPSAFAPPRGCSFHPRCPYATSECKEKRPSLTKCKSGQKVACFLYNEVTDS